MLNLNLYEIIEKPFLEFSKQAKKTNIRNNNTCEHAVGNHLVG